MAEESTEKEAPKKGGKGLLIIIIVLLLLVIIGGAVFFLFIKKPADAAHTDAAAVTNGQMAPAQQQAPAPQAPSSQPGPVQAYDAFFVNLADPGGGRYLKISLALELSNDKNFPAEVTSKEAKIKDIILTVLSSKTYDEISTTQGKTALKQELVRRLNTIMSGGRINDIFITEFIVQ